MFTEYRTERRSVGTMYLCLHCSFSYLRGRGKDVGAHDRAIAAIAQHVAVNHSKREAAP